MTEQEKSALKAAKEAVKEAIRLLQKSAAMMDTYLTNLKTVRILATVALFIGLLTQFTGMATNNPGLNALTLLFDGIGIGAAVSSLIVTRNVAELPDAETKLSA